MGLSIRRAISAYPMSLLPPVLLRTSMINPFAPRIWGKTLSNAFTRVSLPNVFAATYATPPSSIRNSSGGLCVQGADRRTPARLRVSLASRITPSVPRSRTVAMDPGAPASTNGNARASRSCLVEAVTYWYSFSITTFAGRPSTSTNSIPGRTPLACISDVAATATTTGLPSIDSTRAAGMSRSSEAMIPERPSRNRAMTRFKTKMYSVCDFAAITSGI